jgi:osmoprotectant transport system ATP-binding protein
MGGSRRRVTVARYHGMTPPTTSPVHHPPAAASDAPGAAEIVFDNVTVRYPGRSAPAVNGLSLVIAAGEICVLVGPSGSGKTTALKLVNRLIPLTDGDIRLDGSSIGSANEVELRRRIGYVIQHVGLFPHLSVGENIAMAPKLLGWERARIKARVDELLTLVGLETNDTERYPAHLSGGQQQRVGLARALAADPLVMLMDEPFGAIDPITRSHLQDEFLRLHREVRKTVILVTHDIDEAIKMGDRIAILREGGTLEQYGAPDEILARPVSQFVERFVGDDRGLKRLALRTAAEVGLEPVSEAEFDGPTAPSTTTVRTLLSLMLTDGAREIGILGPDGRPMGKVSLEVISSLLRSGASS